MQAIDLNNKYWMPFTANRQFKSAPRLMSRAKGMFYYSDDNRPILDGTSGLWCCNAGHGREEIAKAVSDQLTTMEYAPSFQMGHPKAFELAKRLAQNINQLSSVFFTNSGSEAVDTALKIALAYHQANGDKKREWLIGRDKGYHGVGFGGISVGGLANNKKQFGSLLAKVDHLPSTFDITRNAFSRGLPIHGEEYADALEAICRQHGGETIAAVIVEPIAGSAGVILPTSNYLKRLREICDQHGILLIFDEVITGFGRVGTTFAAQRFDVTPDMITCAKGLTNGAIPMGAVLVDKQIHDTFMRGPEEIIELFHGYTYSGHPVAVAAAMATLDIYEKEQLFQRSRNLENHWQAALHSLSDIDAVIDVRNYGLMGAIELAPRESTTTRAYDVFTHCFHHNDLLIRVTGDVVALSPPLIASESHIDEIIHRLRQSMLAIR